MMTVLSKRYVAPLIKALKPRRHTRTTSRALSVTSEKRGKEVPSEADVVVIGGGSLGCQTLYHLAKLGVTNTVLLEKEQLTAGTTWHTAGLFWSLRPNDTEIELLTHTRKVITGLQEETGVDPGWINNGGLFIANNKERMEEYRRLYTMGKVLGIESHLLSPEETKRLYPLMNVDDIYGTLYSPLDGTIDPHGLCTALSRYATRSGAKVLENCPVTDITTRPATLGSNAVDSVVTPFGTIKTKCVVNCTGAWAGYVSDLVGISTPLVAMQHAYVVTEKIPGIENMPNVRDHDASVYLKLQGDALQVGGYEVNPVFIDSEGSKRIAKDFAFGLYELDYDVFGVHIEGAVNRVPCLEESGIKSTVCGPESFTPDHKPIMGEDPRVRGFFHGVGFNSAGMMLGGGCGEQLAKWVVNGRPSLDMYGYDIRRFCPQVSQDREWVDQRSHEAYAKNYAMVFPHDEALAGRNMKKDPLHQILETAGCVYQERFGWERPGWFTMHGPTPVKAYDWYGAYDNLTNEEYGYKERLQLDYTFDHPKIEENIKAECLATRTTAGLFNMSYFGKFYLTGPDAQAAVDWIFTAPMTGTEGKTIYTCMLNKGAGIEADLTVSIIGSGSGSSADPSFDGRGFYIAAAGGAAYQNFAHIQTAIQDGGFNVTLEDRSQEMGMLSLQGPAARHILEKLTDAPLDNLSFPFSTNKMIEVAGHQVRALRVSFVGELGWELHIPSDSCIPVYLALTEAGKEFGMVNAGYRAIDSLSIEKGYPHWHQEVRMDDTPLEGGLLFTCKLKTDTDFLGRTALEAQRKEGARKKKVCFTVDDQVCLLGLEGILRNGEYVGHLRRGDHAHYLDTEVGYGYVSRPDGEKVTPSWLKEGNYQIESRGRKYEATLHMKTPFDPSNDRIQGRYDAIGRETETQNKQQERQSEAMH